MSENIVDLFTHRSKKERKQRIGAALEELPEITRAIQEFHNGNTDKIVCLANRFGILITQIDLPVHLAGFLFPAPSRARSGWEIVVSRNLSEEEKRWTVAHEIAHWILDKKCEPPEFDDISILPRIRFLRNSAKRKAYEAYTIEEVRVRVSETGEPQKAWTSSNQFVWDVSEILESEISANVLAGYLVLPTRFLVERVKAGFSVTEIAAQRRLPVGVVAKQIRNERRIALAIGLPERRA